MATPLLVLTLVMGFSLTGRAFPTLTEPQAQDSLLQVGEELEYKVSYSIFTLGTIRIRVTEKSERNGRPVYKAQAFIDSAPGLPFVDLHVLFESEFDEDIYAYSWVSKDSSRNEINYLSYAFDYPQNRVLVEKSVQRLGSARVVEKVDTVALNDKAQDGLSLFFYARKHLHRQGQVNIPTVIGNEVVKTTIAFLNKRSSEEIDALEDQPLDVKEFQGRANYSGVFGLTGAFSGWFSNDNARVPIIARMQVILGSIYIELKKWNRTGWQPPNAQEK